MTQRSIPALYMRGGTSKGVFLLARDLPPAGAARDKLLLRIIGSPDGYKQQMDGMGAATSSTSKVVVLAPSTRPDCDVDYLFGQVSIDEPMIDWSGNCGNLSAAVGPFAFWSGLLPVPADGVHTVRIWQANIGKRILAHVPVAGGEVVEEGTFMLDGVSFPSAEIALDFIDPGGTEGERLLPTGNAADRLEIAGVGVIEATMINAGNPTVVVPAEALGLRGDELPAQLNGDAALLARCEAIRAAATVRMGLAPDAESATRDRPATPKLAFVAAPAGYQTSDGRRVEAGDIDVLVRILSMGRVHHALTGTGGIALAVAASMPGTTVHRAARAVAEGAAMRIGHPAGVIPVIAEAALEQGEWNVARVRVSRSARRLMAGQVFVPADTLQTDGQETR